MSKARKKATKKAKTKTRRGLKLGQIRRGAASQLRKVQDALKQGKVSDTAKAKKLMKQLKAVVARADDDCPFEVQLDPLV